MAISFVSAGAGNRATGNSATLGTTWTHNVTVGGPDTVLVVAVTASVSSNTVGMISVENSGQDMALAGHIQWGSSTSRSITSIFYSFNPGVSNQTITVRSATSTKAAIAGTSMLYSGVGGIEVGGSSNGTTSPVSVTVPTGGMAVGVHANGAAISGVSHTERYRTGTSVNGVGDYIAVQDTSTAGSVGLDFVGTATTPGSMAIILRPGLATPASGVQLTSGTKFWNPDPFTPTMVVPSDPNTAVLVALCWNQVSGTSTPDCKVGGVALDLLSSASSGTVRLTLFGSKNIPAGSQDVKAQMFNGSTQAYAQGAWTFKNVAAFSGAATQTNTATPLNINSAVGDAVFSVYRASPSGNWYGGVGFNIETLASRPDGQSGLNQYAIGYGYGTGGAKSIYPPYGGVGLGVNMVSSELPTSNPGQFFALFF